MNTFKCDHCQKDIRDEKDEISYFDNSLCASCENDLFIHMNEENQKMKATSPDTLERYYKANNIYCYKCLQYGAVQTVEAGDQSINYCRECLEQFKQTYNV